MEDFEDEHVYHKERFVLLRAKALEPQLVAFTIPLFEPLPAQYLVRVVSETWLGAESVLPLPLHSLALPAAGPTHTPLLPLRPLPRAALANARFERLFRFAHFNPVQTQLFHATYHTDENVLVGAPTGSGKTVTAELAVLRLLAAHPGKKAVYIAPLKALVRERMADWGRKLAAPLGLRLVELTGDVSPDMHALRTADVLCTTPEKWDSVSRGWQSRGCAAERAAAPRRAAQPSTPAAFQRPASLLHIQKPQRQPCFPLRHARRRSPPCCRPRLQVCARRWPGGD